MSFHYFSRERWNVKSPIPPWASDLAKSQESRCIAWNIEAFRHLRLERIQGFSLAVGSAVDNEVHAFVDSPWVRPVNHAGQSEVLAGGALDVGRWLQPGPP